MIIEKRDKGGMMDSYTPGAYSGCGCGNRRYYTKDEVDALLAGIIDPDEIEQIINNLFEEYIEEGDLEQLIIDAIAGMYTNEEIDAMLAELETRIKTWVENKGYLTDIDLTINGRTLHNGDSINIEGGDCPDLDDYATKEWVEAKDYPSKNWVVGHTDLAILDAVEDETARTENVYLKKTEFNSFRNEMEECCDDVNNIISNLLDRISDLEEVVAGITGSTPTPDTGDTPTTGKYVLVTYNVTSTTEPTRILYTTEKVSSIETPNGTPVPVSQYYTFSNTGSQTLKFNYTGSTLYCGGRQWQGLKQIVTATFNNLASAQYSFNGSYIQSVTVRNSSNYAFANCTNLSTVNYGSGFGEVPVGAFSGCTALNQDFVVADGVTQIWGFAFRNSGINSLTVPASLTEIRGGALLGCTNLDYVRFKGTTPPTVFDNGLGLSTYTFPIYVPSSAVNAYKNALPSNYSSRIQAWTGN